MQNKSEQHKRMRLESSCLAAKGYVPPTLQSDEGKARRPRAAENRLQFSAALPAEKRANVSKRKFRGFRKVS
jgi:hypothetical protein